MLIAFYDTETHHTYIKIFPYVVLYTIFLLLENRTSFCKIVKAINALKTIFA